MLHKGPGALVRADREDGLLIHAIGPCCTERTPMRQEGPVWIVPRVLAVVPVHAGQRLIGRTVVQGDGLHGTRRVERADAIPSPAPGVANHTARDRIDVTTIGKQLFTTLDASGSLTLEIAETTFAAPSGNQVLVQIEAAPINPSDLAILAGAAELEDAEYTPGKIVARMPEPFLSGSKGRHGMRLPAGNEGAGVVVATGDSDMAKALMGQRVACVPGSAFSQYAVADAAMCLPLGDHSSERGAGSFVNPMTALAFVETAKMERHDAIIHLAAASNLGRMLVKVCKEDGVALVNIVRKQSQVELLEGLGAQHVVNSSGEDFMKQLRAAIDTTGAYLGFDPIGGGRMTDACLTAMEQVAASKMTEYSRYGSSQDKKMYMYGRLDFAPTILSASYGLQWTVSGWLLTPFLQRAGMETIVRMRQRVLQGLDTTFASNYKARGNLEQMLSRDAILDYRQMKTGNKYLVTPQS